MMMVMMMETKRNWKNVIKHNHSVSHALYAAPQHTYACGHGERMMKEKKMKKTWQKCRFEEKERKRSETCACKA